MFKVSQFSSYHLTNVKKTHILLTFHPQANLSLGGHNVMAIFIFGVKVLVLGALRAEHRGKP